MEWECQICGFINDEEEPPSTCPVCGAPASKFSERYEDNDLLTGSDRGNGDDDEEQDFYGEFE